MVSLSFIESRTFIIFVEYIILYSSTTSLMDIKFIYHKYKITEIIYTIYIV